MAKGTIGSDGTVIITFNVEEEDLGVENMKYLPCEGCGYVEPVELPVLAYPCRQKGDANIPETRIAEDSAYDADYEYAAGHRGAQACCKTGEE